MGNVHGWQGSMSSGDPVRKKWANSLCESYMLLTFWQNKETSFLAEQRGNEQDLITSHCTKWLLLLLSIITILYQHKMPHNKFPPWWERPFAWCKEYWVFFLINIFEQIRDLPEKQLELTLKWSNDLTIIANVKIFFRWMVWMYASLLKSSRIWYVYWFCWHWCQIIATHDTYNTHNGV